MDIAQREAAVREAVDFLSVKHQGNLTTFLESNFAELPTEIKGHAHDHGSDGNDIEDVFHDGVIYFAVVKLDFFLKALRRYSILKY